MKSSVMRSPSKLPVLCTAGGNRIFHRQTQGRQTPLSSAGSNPEDLPSNAEIREQIQVFARLHEGDRRTVNLRTMRSERA